MALRSIAVPPAAHFLKGRTGSAQLKDWVRRWISDQRVLVTGMWSLLAQLLSAAAPSRLKSEVIALVKAHAGGLGPEAAAFVGQLAGASPEWRVKALALLPRHPAAVRALVVVARDGSVRASVRAAALRALEKTVETAFLRRAVSALAGQAPLAAAVRKTLAGWDSRRSSSLEEVAAAKVGTTLRDRVTLVEIDDTLDLGVIDFGGPRLEFWDPIQTAVLPLKVALPRARAAVTAQVSAGRAVVLRLRFAAGKVTRWQRVGEVSSPFGTLVLSQLGVAKEVDDPDLMFWDRIFDAAFDERDVASVIDLQVGEESVALLAWVDGQRGGTLFRGSDARGRVVELLFDGVRITPVDATFR